MFHLINHAFFKALLFLGAGSVIHAFLDEQDIRKMGGLYYYTPLTYISMLIGNLALMGFPFFSGYYSKDLIIESALKTPTVVNYFCCFFSFISCLFYCLLFNKGAIFSIFNRAPR